MLEKEQAGSTAPRIPCFRVAYDGRVLDKQVTRVAFLACGAALLLVAGCTSLPRAEAPTAVAIAAAPPGFPASVRAVAADRRYVVSLNAGSSSARGFLPDDALRRLRAAATDGTLDILSLSGGGAGGAFGAGALVGLSRLGRRPQFEMVTGVSTGALIAPFAFLGPAWDPQLLEAFSDDRLEHLLEWRGPTMVIPASIYEAGPLVRLVDRVISDQLIDAVAAEAAKGRLLLVATTDLDKEETVIWNMGEIAARGGPAARRLFREVLVASASLPGVFPPAMVQVQDSDRTYEEMHVDGGAIVPFFGMPELAPLWPADFRLLRGANLYVLVNSQLGVSPSTTPVKPIEILERSFSTTLKHMARTELNLTAAFAERYGMSFRFAEIPIDYPFRGFLDFTKPNLTALFNYAEDRASQGLLWTTVDRARPPRATRMQASGNVERKQNVR